jgi:hypothetical protein
LFYLLVCCGVQEKGKGVLEPSRLEGGREGELGSKCRRRTEGGLSERPWSFDPAGKPKGMSQTTQLYHLSEPLRLPRVPVCCALCDPLYCLNPRCHPILLFKNVGYVIDPRLRVGDDPACLVTTQTTQASRGVFPPKEIPRTPHPAISL